MALTIDQRLDILERGINRVLEALTEKATVDDGDTYSLNEDTGTSDLNNRIMTLERLVQVLKAQAVLIKRKATDATD